jgi:hypothetical protein
MLVYHEKAMLVLINFSPDLVKSFSISQDFPILKPGKYSMVDLYGTQTILTWLLTLHKLC